MPRPRVISDPARISITFDHSDYESVKAIAKTERVSKAWVVRRAVREWLHSEKRQIGNERQQSHET